MNDETHISGADLTPKFTPAERSEQRRRIGVQPGDLVLNSYRITREVARGGMGALYEGRHDITGNRVAIKIVLEEFASEEMAIKLFEREAIALSKITHDAIVGYRDILRDETGRLFIIMDFVDGEPLSRFVGRARLPAKGVRILAQRLADGLAAAHAAGVTHRDMAPKNILLPDEDIGKATIIDFGIAKHMSEDGGTVIGDKFAGTLSHAAPEQLGLFTGKVDHRADIYALGIILVEVSGFKLNLGTTFAEAVLARQQDIQLPEGFPPELVPMVGPMLKANPAERPESMAQAVSADLLDALDDGAQDIDEPTGGSLKNDDPEGQVQQNPAISRLRDASELLDPVKARDRRVGNILIGVLCAAAIAIIGFLGYQFKDQLLGSVGSGGEQMSFTKAREIVQDASRTDADKILAAKALVQEGGDKNLEIAFGVYRTLAKNGSAEAALRAGEMYDPAHFDPRTSIASTAKATSAARWYRIARDAGSQEARQRLERLGLQ